MPSVGNTQVPVVTDITSSGLGTEVPDPNLPPPPDGVYDITGGTRPGGGLNLFHSFGDFSIGQGNIANFLNDSGLATANIIGRVTGGNPSNIDGIIRTTGFDVGDLHANLFLVNPAGIIFGPQGSFDVTGSVSMSTADYLRFENQSTLFDMLSSQTSLGSLDVAPVVAFGFLGPDMPAPITVQGSMLQVQEGQSLSLVGGDITVQAETFEDGTMQAANLRAPGGQLNMVSVASPGEVLVPSFQTGPNINGASFTTMGTVMLKDGATLDVSGQLDEFGIPIGNGNSGTVFVRGGQLVMEASKIQAITWGTVDGLSTAVDIQVSEKIALTIASTISTVTFGSGRGGDVLLTAPTLTIENSLQSILTGTFGGDGVGGDVVLNVGTVSLMGGSSIESSSQNFTPGLGQGGNVTIQGLEGAGNAAELVALSSDSSLSSATAGSGAGGRVDITSKSLTMDGVDGAATTINTSTTEVGRGGDIVVAVQHASLLGGATIKTLTSSGDPNAPAGASVTVQGLQGAGSMADSVTLSGLGSGIISDAQGHGTVSAGDVTVHAKTVSLTDGAVIQSGTQDTTGAGGNVTIVAGLVDISGGSGITSQARGADAGQIQITANRLILNNVSIASNTASSGRGGDVVLNVGTVGLSNGATINSSTSEAGRAGDITMNVGSLTLANHAEITSSSSGGIEIEARAVNAGNITIQSGSTVMLNNSSITTEARQASGGQIEINAPEMVRLTNSRISTSVKGAAGDSDGGNITIDPQFVVLQNSQVIAQAFAGAGGAINIIATSAFIADPLSIVNASSTLGISGTVNIQSPLQNVGGELAPLSEEFSSAAALLAQQCAARAADGKFSTFVVASREGLPVELGGFLASPSVTSELLGSRISGRASHSQLSTVTGLFPKYDARPIQLAKLGNACR
jgi:filamentous hemagglutinin family protein